MFDYEKKEKNKTLVTMQFESPLTKKDFLQLPGSDMRIMESPSKDEYSVSD